jgi:hypothetical protein
VKLLLALLAVLAASFFIYRYYLTRDERHLGAMWGGRVLLSLAFAAVVLLALFMSTTATTWRFF